ncbi:hypothetical protein [Streptomyces sp. NPDC001165]|uniref:hypothetical protein n=1 Tax=Streptomyces sp. NPDC001165 TaxID=3364546 RepID=UPI0036A4A9FE
MKTLLAPDLFRPPVRPGSPRRGSRPPLHAGEDPLREKASAAGLRALREADLHRTVERLAAAGTSVRVGRYTLVEPRQDPADRLAQTQAVVRRQGWQATVTTFDSTGVSDPAIRPQMARLYAALCRGEIHGIVAVSQVDISAFHDVYADTLTVLRARGGFLALARHETTI